MKPRERWALFPLSWKTKKITQKLNLSWSLMDYRIGPCCPKSQVKALSTRPLSPSGVPAFQLPGKKGIFVLYNSKKPLWALAHLPRVQPVYSGLQVGSWIWPSMNRSLCWLLPGVHSQLYVGQNHKPGQECLSGGPSWPPSVCWLLFFIFVSATSFLSWVSIFSASVNQESRSRLRSSGHACASERCRPNPPGILQPTGLGTRDSTFLPAVLPPISYPPHWFGVSLFSWNKTGQWWRKETAKRPSHLYTIFMLSPTLSIYIISCFCN